MNRKQNRHIVDILFVIALFSIFVLSAISLISIGAGVYSKTMTNMDSNFSSRTAVAYIKEKIRQSDENGSISVGDLDGNPAIVISSRIRERDYTTYIYEYEGILRELMIRNDVTLSPSAGQKILPVSSFKIDMDDRALIRCQLMMEDGEFYDFFVGVHSRSGKGGDGGE
ncbi:MAG: DUF4860 domain-containing protein [Lachnospiraceae bacterium]|nr:DUF4860 domain-containing protein [Lachnospiraceae bacterium]